MNAKSWNCWIHINTKYIIFLIQEKYIIVSGSFPVNYDSIDNKSSFSLDSRNTQIYLSELKTYG